MPVEYAFGSFVLKPDLGRLESDGQVVFLRAKSFALLCHFAANAGRVIPKSELVDVVWAGLAISDDAITQTVRDVRKGLGDGGGRLIRTIPKRGYVFLPNGMQDGDPKPRNPPGSHRRAAGTGPIGVLHAHVAESWSDVPDPSLMETGTGRADLARDGEHQTSRPSRPTIVLLPLRPSVRSFDPARAVNWADGLVRDATRQLARLRSFFVVSAASSQAVVGRGVVGSEAAKVLRADYFCGGTLEVDDDAFHIEVELVRTGDGRLLWSDRWSEPWAEATRAGSEMAGLIAREIALHIEVAEQKLTLGKPACSLNGWESLHRGLWHMHRFTSGDNEAAEKLFSLAVDLDPSLARAHAGLSFTQWLKAYVLAPGAASEMAAGAYSAAARAVAADPLDPAAQTALGRALWINGAVDDATEPLRASIRLSPNFAFGHYAMGFIACVSGDPMEGIEAIDMARRLSPLDPFLCAMHASRAIALLRLGQVEEAASWGKRAALQPNAHAHVRRIGAVCLAAVGKVEQAREQARAIDVAFPESSGEAYFRSLRLAPDAERMMRSLGKSLGWT